MGLLRTLLIIDLIDASGSITDRSIDFSLNSWLSSVFWWASFFFSKYIPSMNKHNSPTTSMNPVWTKKHSLQDRYFKKKTAIHIQAHLRVRAHVPRYPHGRFFLVQVLMIHMGSIQWKRLRRSFYHSEAKVTVAFYEWNVLTERAFIKIATRMICLAWLQEVGHTKQPIKPPMFLAVCNKHLLILQCRDPSS